MSYAAALIAVDMQCNQNLKCELEIQRGGGGVKSDSAYCITKWPDNIAYG